MIRRRSARHLQATFASAPGRNSLLCRHIGPEPGGGDPLRPDPQPPCYGANFLIKTNACTLFNATRPELCLSFFEAARVMPDLL